MSQQHRILVIGSSGYLGRVITKLLSSEHILFLTHNRNPYFSGSIQYSFPHSDLKYFVQANQIDTCIFSAEIEKNQNNHKLDDLNFFHDKVEKFIAPFSYIRFVYISSDGIFDGKQGLYAESDIPQPIAQYGRKLKICEDIVRTHCSNFCIIRPSYLYGHALGLLDGRLQRTKNYCESQQVVFYFEDMFKSPLHVWDAAKLIIMLTFSNYVGVIHIGGPRMSVFDFHREAMAAMGIPGQISPNKMPMDAGLLHDTSLNTELCKALTGFTQKTVADSFSKHL